MWEGLTQQSLECAELRFGASEVQLGGTMLAMEGGHPLRLEYRIVCDSAWGTRRVLVSSFYNGAHAQVSLQHDGAGNWLHNGTEEPKLSGCIDVDLEASPATNALPIRRLSFAKGTYHETLSAWISVPSLRVEPTCQTYKRLGENDYEYSDHAGAFRALLHVDPEGLPTSYGCLWRRVQG